MHSYNFFFLSAGGGGAGLSTEERVTLLVSMWKRFRQLYGGKSSDGNMFCVTRIADLHSLRGFRFNPDAHTPAVPNLLAYYA